MEHTSHFELTQYEPEDIVNFITQYNSDMLKIDTGLYTVIQNINNIAGGLQDEITDINAKLQHIRMAEYNSDNSPYITMSDFDITKPFKMFLFNIIGNNNDLSYAPFAYYKSSTGNLLEINPKAYFRYRQSSGGIFASEHTLFKINFNIVNGNLWVEHGNGDNYGDYLHTFYTLNTSGSTASVTTEDQARTVTAIKFDYIMLQ